MKHRYAFHEIDTINLCNYPSIKYFTSLVEAYPKYNPTRNNNQSQDASFTLSLNNYVEG